MTKIRSENHRRGYPVGKTLCDFADAYILDPSMAPSNKLEEVFVRVQNAMVGQRSDDDGECPVAQQIGPQIDGPMQLSDGK